MVHRSLSLVCWFTFLLIAAVSASGAPEAPKLYTADKRAIYFDGKAIFTLPKDEIDGRFKGPITFGNRVVFIEATRNLALAFEDSRVVDRKTISRSSSRSDFPMHISTQAIIRVSQGLLIYNLHGEARMLTQSFSVKRMKALDIDPSIDGTPQLYAWETVMTGKQRMECSKSTMGDRYVILDLDALKLVERGAMPKDNPLTPNLPR